MQRKDAGFISVRSETELSRIAFANSFFADVNRGSRNPTSIFIVSGCPLISCEATVWIDDHELSLREFGRLLTTHAGWGMRIVFVPEDDLNAMHPIEIREPGNEPPN
jgi:hypothetical protein